MVTSNCLPYYIVPTTNWSVRKFLNERGFDRKPTNFDDVVSQKLERVLLSRLRALIPAADSLAIRFASLGHLTVQTPDAMAFDDDGVVIFEIKHTTRRSYVADGLAQLDRYKRVLRKLGYEGSIRTRLIVVSAREGIARGLAPLLPLTDLDRKHGIVMVSPAQIESYASAARIPLPSYWWDPATRFASRFNGVQRRRGCH